MTAHAQKRQLEQNSIVCPAFLKKTFQTIHIDEITILQLVFQSLIYVGLYQFGKCQPS